MINPLLLVERPILGAIVTLGLSTGFSIPFLTMSFFIGKSGWIKNITTKQLNFVVI